MAKQIKYTDQFRRQAVAIYEEGNRSAAQVARIIGIHEHTLCNWIKLYGNDKATPLQHVRGQIISQEGPFPKQEADFRHAYALEYIQTIKRHAGALETLLFQQTDHKSS